MLTTRDSFGTLALPSDHAVGRAILATARPGGSVTSQAHPGARPERIPSSGAPRVRPVPRRRLYSRTGRFGHVCRGRALGCDALYPRGLGYDSRGRGGENLCGPQSRRAYTHLRWDPSQRGDRAQRPGDAAVRGGTARFQ